MSVAADPFNEFFVKTCGMSASSAKTFQDGLEAKGIDGVKIARIKAKDGSLEPLLTTIATAAKVDNSYVKIVLAELKNNSNPNAAADLAQKQKEVDAVLKAAREYREAASRTNKAALATAFSTLNEALQKVAPDARWNVPQGTDLLSKMNSFITSVSGLSDVVMAGNYQSDYQMLTDISEGVLRKAAIFLPGKPIGKRGAKHLYNFQIDVTKSELSKTHVLEQQFSDNDVFASYKSALTKDGSANTITAEVGAFFGFGAVAVTGSYSGSSASETSSYVNTLTETHEAMGIKVQCVQKASVTLNLKDLILVAPNKIQSKEDATAFFQEYGTHIITASQSLGGLFVQHSRVTFKNSVQVQTYKEAVSKTLSASESLSGWGVTEGGIGKGSEAAAHDSSSTSALAGGTTFSNDSYTASVTTEVIGPTSLDAAAFRASLNNGNQSWGFINNGLCFLGKNRDNVIHQIAPVWLLFDLADRGDEATLLRQAWLDRVLDTDAIIDPNSFFSQLVYKTLHSDPLKGDLAGWTKTYEEKLAQRRVPPAILEKDNNTTSAASGGTEFVCKPLSLHAVRPPRVNHVLNRFKLKAQEHVLEYYYESIALTAFGEDVITVETEATTPRTEGTYAWYLGRHLVKAPLGSVLTGFQLQSDEGNIWYKYTYAQLSVGGLKITYSAAALERSDTLFDIGASKQLMYLDRHDICSPAGHLLVGFRLVPLGDNIKYEFWHVPITSLKVESKLI